MPKNRRLMCMEEAEGASGEVPEYGAIFMSNSSTKKECLRRGLFGLPVHLGGFVKQVKAGMIMFLFEFESRELHGVFQASSDGAMNIDPHAFSSSGKQFPAQVKFTEMWRFRPLCESEFRHAICENYFTPKKFNFGLSKAQVQRLLKLFSLQKVERSRLRKTTGPKHSRESESSLGITAGGRGSRNRCLGDRSGDDDREFPIRDTSVEDLAGCSLTEKYDSTQRREYSREPSGVCRRPVDSTMHGSKDIVGHGFSMNDIFQTDALTKYSNRSVVNGRRHTASGWLDTHCHEKDGFAEASLWANHEERSEYKPEPVVPAQSSVPLESPYGTSKDYYDPCEPGITTMKSTSHYNVDPMCSAFYTAESNYVLRENVMRDGGGYVSDNLPLEPVQPFPDEHNVAVVNRTSSPDLDYYIPMPTEHLEYQTNTGMAGVTCSESEYESRDGRLRQLQFPDLLTSEEATENMRNLERPSYSSNNSIFPSFANPLSSRDLSPNDRADNEISAYQQHLEVSYSNDRRVAQGSRIYPSFTSPPTSEYRADLYPENRTQAYRRREEHGGDAFDSKNRVIRMGEDHVNAAEHERKRTRKSVFSRLAMPSKEELDVVEKDTAPDTESVDDVMAFLNDCHKHWMEQKRSSLSSSPEGFGKQKKKKKHLSEVIGNDSILPFSEATPADDDLLDCDGIVQKLPFIDFKRRSKAQKSSGNSTEECKDTHEQRSPSETTPDDDLLEQRPRKLPFIDFKRRSKAQKSSGQERKDSAEQHSAPQNKKRKLLRPKLEDDSEKDRANNDNHIEKTSQAATNVPVQVRGDQ